MHSETVTVVHEMHSIIPISLWGSTSLYDTTATNRFQIVFLFSTVKKIRNDLAAQKREVNSNM